MKWIGLGSREERRRFFEVMAMMGVTLLFVALSRLEGRLFDLSKALSQHQEFLNSLVYFGLINVNVVLILILSFLLFRNIAKLVVDRRRGVIGSRLRTKLVIALVFFAVAPTALLFYISTRFLTESFETWFSSRVEATMHRTREAGAMVYDRDQRRLANLARIALQRVDIEAPGPFQENDLPHLDPARLKGFAREFRVSSVRVYNQDAEAIWRSDADKSQPSSKELRFVVQALQRFQANAGMISRAIIDADEGRDVVRGVAPLLDPSTRKVLGVIVVEERFETQILQSVETIIEQFASLKPGAELIRLSYVILLILMVVIIVFSATWLGFYVARGIIAPIQTLADATREIAIGNYNIALEVKSDDETGQLTRAFNSMTSDLRASAYKVRDFTAQLEKTNEELDQRRKYMEVILRNINAGVISVDPSGRVASINRAAERLLNLEAVRCLGLPIEQALEPGLVEMLWQPIAERVQFAPFSGEIDLADIGRDLTLIADATRILDEDNEDLGIVIVFDDASEQIKAQRVAAWREVARRIAHEIKNPITPIKISAQRLLRKFGDQFTGKDYQVFVSCIETIISEVDALRDLVNEFSKFSRLPTVKTKPENVNTILRDVVGLFSMSYSAIEFDSSGLAEDLPLVALDREHMVRVFTNIITNAIASIPEERDKGAIALRTLWLYEYQVVRVEIADNGCGIPDHLKQRVLEPYFSTKKEGTGLGLAIVNQIVSDHGGYLRIIDNQPIGTVIVIELPRDEAKGFKRT
jgi:two-component system nitrogen regulation sensor histidine kinase NtrY